MLNDELELLQNIYIDELVIARDVSSPTPASVTIQVHPATCDRADEQYVCVTATFRLPPEYPAVPPIFDLSSPRGLADEELDLLRARVGSLLAASVGAPMLHEAIELVREVLTDSNVPHGQCSICLSGFDGRISIAKTDCYHYFHACCLARYVLHKSKEPSDGSLSELPPPGSSAVSTRAAGLGGATEVYPCPVCRKAMIHGPSATAAAGLLAIAEPAAGYNNDDTLSSSYVPTSEVLRHREDMRRLYERQLRNGGIIDIEAERARLQLPPPLPPQAPSNMTELVSDSLAVVSSQTDAAVVLSCAAAGATAGLVKVSSLGNSSAAPPAGPAATAAAPASRAGFPETHTVSGSQRSHRQQQQRRQHLACAKSYGGSTRHPPRDKRQRPDAAAGAAAAAERGNELARLPGASSAGRHGSSAATAPAAAAVRRCDDGGGSGGCSGRP